MARAWIADRAPPGAGGTAFGVFAAASGAALLTASVVAGALWTTVGPRAAFLLGVASSLAALVLLGILGLAGHARAR